MFRRVTPALAMACRAHREERGGVRVLVITSGEPVADPLDRRGSARRLGTFVQGLAALGGQITMACMVPPARLVEYADAEALDRQQSEYWGCPLSVHVIPRAQRSETFRNHYLAGILCAAEQPHIHSFAGRSQAAAIARLLDPEPEIIFVFHLAAMCALLRTGLRPRNLFFDLDDVEHAVRLRYALQRPVWPGKLAYVGHVPALIAAERAGAARSRLLSVCSHLDVARLSRVGIRRNVCVIPNAVPIPVCPAPLTGEPTVMFIGALDYQPNIEAAERLALRIMPRIRASRPDARLLIVGRGGEELPSRRQSPPGVEYLGFVPDLDRLYARTRVVCCPIVNGGGTRVKLLEAAAYARPIISTQVGAEGLDFVDGRDILLLDEDDAIAERCICLLGDDQLAVRLGAAARRMVEERYDSERIARQIAEGLQRRLLHADGSHAEHAA